MSEGNREQSDHEATERKRAESLFFDYAKTHINQILKSDDWTTADLSNLYYRPLPEKGSWVIYCKAGENEARRVGITMYDRNGRVFDVIEFEADDFGIPLSPEQTIAPQKTKVENPETNKEDEVRQGKYLLTVRYKKHGGVEVAETIHEINAYKEMTKEQLLENARSWISMTGLHNFGLATSDGKAQRVYFTLVYKNDESTHYESNCLVDQAGHIVKE